MLSPSRTSLALAVFALASLAGCSPSNQLKQLHGKTMGTTYHVSYVASESSAGPSAKAIDDLLAEINQSMSTYMESSVISRINASTDTTIWHEVDNHFRNVFLRSRVIHKDTGGAFNPAVGPLVDAWGFGPKTVEGVPDDATVQALLKVSSFDAFEFRESPPAVRKSFPAAQLDFSAIAKGYAVDAIAMLMEQTGVMNYVVEIGGEVRARGHRQDGSAWKVGIEKPSDDPLAPTRIETIISLDNAGLATSGTYRNFTTENDKNFSHILDPKTGYPVMNSVLSVSVLAEDTTTADAYATALVVMGMEDGLRFVEDRKNLGVYFIAKDDTGSFVEKHSPGFPEFQGLTR